MGLQSMCVSVNEQSKYIALVVVFVCLGGKWGDFNLMMVGYGVRPH